LRPERRAGGRGWQLSGLLRVTSGFPVNVDNGYSNYPTNFQQEGNANLVAPVQTGAYTVQSGPDAGNINIFKNGPAAISSFDYAYRVRRAEGTRFAATATSVSIWVLQSAG
jgi:hypothetical protein